MATETRNDGSTESFGSCCEELRQIMAGGDFEPLITIGADGILYMSVGLIDIEEDEPGMVDHPVFFCPFCGTKVQDPDKVRDMFEEPGAA